MCLYPKLIKNRKYQSNKKNGGQVPPLPYRKYNGNLIQDERVLWVPVGCGKCIECMKMKARNWQVRLLEEVKHNYKALFVTLTFNNEELKKLSKMKNIEKLSGYEKDNEIAKTAVRRFLERWRKSEKKSVKHWLITELGHNGTENIHLHGILWTQKNEKFVTEKWKYGYVWTNEGVGKISPKVVNYIIKYCTKIDEKHKEYKPIILCSAGIGKQYIESYNAKINKYKAGQTKEYYKNEKGYKQNLPIYYRNHIYSEDEKEKLWIEKIEKGERYVNGIKAESEENYWKLLENARIKNRRLGYGNDEINWERRRYENELRNLKFLERTKK